MMEEMSSIFWGLSLAVNIILVLIGLPLCLLICCCCRKHQGTIEKDLKDIARNHNLLQNGETEQIQYQQQPMQQKRLIRNAPRKRPVAQVKTVEPEDDDVIPNLDEVNELEE